MNEEQRPSAERDEASVIRHEEGLRISKGVEEIGTLRIRKRVEPEEIEGEVPRGLEHAKVQRVVPGDEDSGEIETLADGSVSIPVFEEELVISRRLVVRERIVVTKQTVYQPEHIREDVRRERVEIERTDRSEDFSD
jgi:uncharacterized protein (TIGR02271 family)